MADQPDIPMLDVAVALIRRGEHVLTVFNPKWSSFTLPMTKRRVWQDPHIPQAHREEEWADAAVRAAAEWLGRTSTFAPRLLIDVPEFRQSDREGIWKRYHFQVFDFPLEDEDLRPAGVTEWLAPREILDPQRRPISPSARHLIGKLLEAGCFD